MKDARAEEATMPWYRLWPRRRDLVVDLLIAGVVAMSAFAPLNAARASGGGLAAMPFLGAAGVVLLARRRAPVVTLGVVTALCVAAWISGHRTQVVEIPIAIAMYTVARNRPRQTTVPVAIVLGIVLSAGMLLSAIGGVRSLADVLAPAILQPAVLVGFAAALGAAIKANREAVDAANDRARRAEESREAEANRRVAEDRLAIARDLHDSVAHRIAVINLHASVAASTVRTRPEDAEQSIAVIGDAARTVISEIQGMLLLLRSGADRPADEEPTLARIDGLLSVFARSGLRVDVTRTGDLDTIGEQASAVAYRVVQEGLTNAYKHADGTTAELRITRTDAEVVVRISNPIVPGWTGTGDGHGLTGMRERAAAVSGTMSTAARGDRWELEASIPVLPRPRDDAATGAETMETV